MTVKRGKTVTAKTAAQATGAAPVTPDKLVEEIKQRAFELHVARGCTPGYELDDWLNAEREIKAKYRIGG